MNRIGLLVTSALVAASAQASTQTNVWHAVQSGRDASVSWYNAGVSGGSVDAFESTQNGNATASIMFNWWTISTSGFAFTVTQVFGFGSIAPGDLQIDPNARSGSLHTTTGAGVTVQTCTWQPFGGFGGCTFSNTPETFDLTWTANGMTNGFSSGVQQFTMGSYSVHTQGTLNTSSADVAGTAGGNTLTGAIGSLNDSRGTQVSRDVFSN